MIFLYVLVFLVFIIDTRFKFCKTGFNTSYLDKMTCVQVKGFMAMLIFLAHGYSYIPASENILYILFSKVHSVLGQLIVVMFLFYSGYGVLKQFKNKGKTDQLFFKIKKVLI